MGLLGYVRVVVGWVGVKLHVIKGFISLALEEDHIFELGTGVAGVAVAVLLVDEVALDDGLRGEVDQRQVDPRHHKRNQPCSDRHHQGSG